MQKAIISVVYHCSKGHTKLLARVIAKQMKTAYTRVHLLTVEEAQNNFDLLHNSDTIVFGCPTYFGNVSGVFKQFMERTGSFWYKQPWKNKLAAAFTVSSTTNGDKLNTLQAIMLFACQHSMNWISLGVLPRFLNDEQTDGQNRLSSYVGLMAQCSNSQTVVSPLHSGDQLTAELFALRIIEVTLQLKNIDVRNYQVEEKAKGLTCEIQKHSSQKPNIMTRIEIENAIQDLNNLVMKGKAMEAFEKYYHDDVSMQENDLTPTVSKSANREREIQFFNDVTDFRGAEVKGLAVGDGISYVNWHYDYTHRHWGVRNYTQVSIQHWKDGKIIHEQFIYSN
jgi:multimeric flavodoxin WrbA